jgi:hypothetical protein
MMGDALVDDRRIDGAKVGCAAGMMTGVSMVQKWAVLPASAINADRQDDRGVVGGHMSGVSLGGNELVVGDGVTTVTNLVLDDSQ